MGIRWYEQVVQGPCIALAMIMTPHIAFHTNAPLRITLILRIGWRVDVPNPAKASESANICPLSLSVGSAARLRSAGRTFVGSSRHVARRPSIPLFPPLPWMPLSAPESAVSILPISLSYGYRILMIPRTYRQDADCGRHYQELFTIGIFTGVKEQEVLSMEGYGTITGTSDPLDSVCDEVVINSFLGRAVSEP